jgi:1-aminocyclopropane-1-carboxylate deaminase
MPLTEFGMIRVEPLSSLYKFYTTVDVLRLDLLHPVVSGNKWFKLQPYINDALQLGKKTIATFGGAYSNHIVATAAACRDCGLQSMGVIRGERPAHLSPTLLEALSYGMELFFVSRDDYRKRHLPPEVQAADAYVVNEGGHGALGAQGAAAILQQTLTNAYTHILAAVGTGTTLAGLALAATDGQETWGIPVLKNNFSLENEISELLPGEEKKEFRLVQGYHFGGYAKSSGELFRFMNRWHSETGIPSDFVYTGKLFFAMDDLLKKREFPEGSRILAIHSGGLQGNRSLPKGTLIF